MWGFYFILQPVVSWGCKSRFWLRGKSSGLSARVLPFYDRHVLLSFALFLASGAVRQHPRGTWSCLRHLGNLATSTPAPMALLCALEVHALASGQCNLRYSHHLRASWSISESGPKQHFALLGIQNIPLNLPLSISRFFPEYDEFLGARFAGWIKFLHFLSW